METQLEQGDLRDVTVSSESSITADFAIVAPFGAGWILESLAQSVIAESALRFVQIDHVKGGTAAAVDAVLREPAASARGAIFAHHIPLMETLKRRPPKQDVLFFGHYYRGPNGGDHPEPQAMAELLRQPALIWTNASYWDRWLIEQGVAPERISRIVHAVDSDRFSLRSNADHRLRPTVGLVSQYHERKNEGFIRDAILRRDDVDWVLLGRNWERTPGKLLEACAARPNFRYIDTRSTTFEHWPETYRQFDIFASPSICEGGPFPLLEAMACGVWPVASNTGFASDFIRPGETGRVHAVDDVAAFDAAIDEGVAIGRDRSAHVRAAVSHLTWRRFGQAAASDLARLRQ